MTLTPSEVASLTNVLSYWETAEYVFGALVTVGCLGEYTAEFTNWFTGGIKERKDRLAKRSTLLLIASLALELICLVRTNQISGRVIGSLNDKAEVASNKSLQAIQDADTAMGKAKRASDESSDAKIVAGKAKDAAGKAEALARSVRKEADSFEKRIVSATDTATKAESHLAEALRQATEAQRELNELRAWRTLSPVQQAEITEALRPFPGTEFLLVVNPTPEAINLTQQIATCLVASHWIWKKVEQFGVPAVTIETDTDKGNAAVWYKSGLAVSFRPRLVAVGTDFPEAAQTLALILGSQRIGTVGSELIPNDPPFAYIPAGVVVLIVGSKP